ncbi:hypothetical protein CPLU01_06723 [Colletotrichum plurivorum]|uniref:Uncharacterized protein n=1 Tax=Colletotrichum plurivorum TaxID=2175906 RepID=A0A8H6NFZ1_9PEZI|nr:hypothetical protein CPLU01_06723 [Colletotrichum plurivorum]
MSNKDSKSKSNDITYINMSCSEPSHQGVGCNCPPTALEPDPNAGGYSAAEAQEMAKWYHEQREQMSQQRSGRSQPRQYRKPKVRDHRPAA